MAISQQDVLNVIAKAKPMGGVEGLKVDVAFAAQGIDSLDRAKIFMSIEDAFNVVIPDDEYDNLTTVVALVAYLSAREQ